MSVGIVQSMRDRIECMRVRPLLQPFLDGELDEARRARLVTHLEACRRCGLAASTYRELSERLQGFGRAADPGAVARLADFVARLDRDDAVEPPGTG